MSIEIQIKVVKLVGGDDNAIFKSKWTERTIDFEVLNKSKNLLLTASFEKEDLEKKKITKVSFNELFKALSEADKDKNYRFEIDNHLLFYKEEPLDDVSNYQKIFMKLPNLKKTKLSHDVAKIISDQLEDMAMLCDKLDEEKKLLKICEVDIDRLNDQYFTLAKEKETYERNVINKCLTLLNEKKKFINDGMIEKNIAEESSLDIHDFILNGGLRISPPKEEIKLEPKSPASSTIKFISKSVTPKSSTPSQKPKRTPSKKLFEQISHISESDEDISVEIISSPSTSKTRKRKSENHDTSSIFKDIKIKTPKKPRREEKESSVEAKREPTEVFTARELLSSSSETKYSDPLDAFKSEDILSQAVCDEIHETQDEVREDQKSSESYKGGKSLRSKKNAYSLDTMNILDM